MPGLEFEWYRQHREETKFEMSMLLGEHKDEISGVFEYDADQFDDETMAEMVRNYFKLLEQAIADPDGRL